MTLRSTRWENRRPASRWRSLTSVPGLFSDQAKPCYDWRAHRYIRPMSHREDWEIAAPAVQRAWVSGNCVILREVRQGQVYSAKPVTVVCDRPDLVALWIAPGTRWKHALRPDGGPVGVEDIMRDRWVLADAVWYGGGALILQI